MAFIPWPNGVQLCFDFVTASQNWQFCLALRKSAGTPTPTDLATIANHAENWWSTNLRGQLTNETTLRQTRATDMTAEGGAVNTFVSSTPGNGAGVMVPIGSAVVVSLRTARRGRSYRGRCYVSGLRAALQNGPTDITAAESIALVGSFAALQTTLDTDGFDVVVASKQHNGAVTNPASLNEVTAFVVDTHFDSQRRRLAGRGT